MDRNGTPFGGGLAMGVKRLCIVFMHGVLCVCVCVFVCVGVCVCVDEHTCTGYVSLGKHYSCVFQCFSARVLYAFHCIQYPPTPSSTTVGQIECSNVN